MSHFSSYPQSVNPVIGYLSPYLSTLMRNHPTPAPVPPLSPPSRDLSRPRYGGPRGSTSGPDPVLSPHIPGPGPDWVNPNSGRRGTSSLYLYRNRGSGSRGPVLTGNPHTRGRHSIPGSLSPSDWYTDVGKQNSGSLSQGHEKGVSRGLR